MNGRWLRTGGIPFVLLTMALAVSSAPPPDAYSVRNLVSDGSVHAGAIDQNLINPWGMARSPDGPWWVANEGSDTSTLYDEGGRPQTLIVGVEGGPTGTVYNGGSGFEISDGSTSAPARFLFATGEGKILGWAPSLALTPPSTRTFVAADASGRGASYTGLTIASTTQGDFLYAADFANGRVDMYDAKFNLIADRRMFVDPRLPEGFAPFGVQALAGRIYVAYALRDEKGEEVAGEGLGVISAFAPDGKFAARVASRTGLNAPWGMALAPAGFGQFSGHLLVGNFGDGRISAFKFGDRYEYRGQLMTESRAPVEIEGLWAIAFGNGADAGPANVLYFTAGPAEETQGLFGAVTADL
jgi:uncharacterized protein (TIGR03118 family)